jgi:hypothetical protein
MIKHFVRFFSPGTLLSEQTDKPVKKWDTKEALKILPNIEERYGAKPYGFCFVTYARGDEDLDSKQTACSGMYYIDAKVETYEEIVKRNLPEEDVLRSNMKINEIKKVVTNGPNSKTYHFCVPLEDEDVILS